MAETKNDSQQETNSVKEENGLDEQVKTNDKPVEDSTKTELNIEIKKEPEAESETNDKTEEKIEVKTEIKKELEIEEKTEIKTEKPDDDANSKPSIPTEELLLKIKKQVEFYFGDVNMQRDKFLIEQTKLDDGWVPMTIMLNFKMLATLSMDIEIILQALESSELIEISEDRKKIRRSLEKPLPTYDTEYRKAQEARTVYLKGFPITLTIENLKSHFESLDSIETIIMRKYKKGKYYFFKGSIFLQFKTLDQAKAFMEQESIKYKDTELIRMWSCDYVASKEKEKEERRQKKAKNQNNTKVNKNHKNNFEDKIKLSKGCIIHISNLDKKMTKDVIKRTIVELETDVAYVDYKNGDPEGWVRLHGENAAVELLKKLDSKVIKIEDCDVTCKLLEGDEEEAYLTKIQENMVSHRQNQREKGRNQRKGFKRRHSPHRFGNAKKVNVDDS